MALASAALRRSALLLAALAVGAPCASAQEELRDERGDPEAERKTILDGNRVAVTVFNYGLSGGVGEVRGNWPRGSNDFYLGDLMLVVGGEVTDVHGQRVPVISAPRGPGNRGIPRDPDTGDYWTFEAVPGYAAEGLDPRTGEPFTMPARSDDPLSWPALWPDRLEDASDPGWPGAWDGLLGKDALIDGVEVYSHLADDAVRTVDYFPDPQDPARQGLGLVVKQRALAWHDPALQDAVVYVWDLANATPTGLDEAVASLVLGTLIGGDGDSQDDVVGHDLARGLVYAYDFDNRGNQGQPVGVLGVVLLPAPGGAGLGGAHHVVPSNAFPLSNGAQVWNEMTSGAVFPQDDCRSQGGCDGDLFVSSEPFALPAFRQQRFAAAVVFGRTLDELRARVDALRAFVADGFAFTDGLVTVTAPAAGTVFTGNAVEVAWETAASGLTVHLDYSADLGRTWAPLAYGLADVGVYTWDASAVPDGAYVVRVTAYDGAQIGGASSGVFTLNRDPANLPPVVALGPLPDPASGVVAVTWQAADPDGDAVAVRLVAEVPGGADVPLADGLPATGTFDWNTAPFPNGLFHLRVEASDGVATGVETSGAFAVENPRQLLHPDAFTEYTGRGEGMVEVRVVDPRAVTGHGYRVTFTGGPEGADAYTVEDETAGTVVVPSAPLLDYANEGPLFDGLRLAVLNPPTALEPDSTGWAEDDGQVPLFADVAEIVEWRLRGRALPFDYEVAFSDEPVTMSLGGIQLGPFGPVSEARLTNVTVTNATYGRPTPFVFLAWDGADGMFSFPASGGPADIVILYDCPTPQNTCTDEELVPAFLLRPDPEADGTYTGRQPTEGDAFLLNTRKAIQSGDAFRFEARLITVSEPTPVPDALTLAAPAPNPAAGRTTLRFALPAPGGVRLRVFDLLGREVTVLLDEARAGGAHAVPVETARLAAGLYLVRLEWGGEVATRRLLVVR
jgi:hypothetical protein